MTRETAERLYPLGAGVQVAVSGRHRFGTDAFLLSDFASPRGSETACDLCAGCGIVAALWFRGRGPLKAYCVELQDEAARLLERTVDESGLRDRMIPIHGDVRRIQDLALEAGRFDVVSCNPPYKQIGRGIPSGEDARLLIRHEAACTLDDACQAARRLLRFGGRLCLCQRPERLADALETMRAHDIEPKRLRFVQCRPDSPPWLFLLEGKRGARPFLQVEAPLMTEGEDGGVSGELRRVYQIKQA